MKLLPGAINFANVHFVSIMLQLEFLCQDSAHNISTSCRLMQSFVGFGKKRGDNKKGNIWFFGLCQPYNFCCFDFILSCLHFQPFSAIFLHFLHFLHFCIFCIFVKTQSNSTQLKATLQQLALELDTVVTCTPPHPPHPPQTFRPLLDQLES